MNDTALQGVLLGAVGLLYLLAGYRWVRFSARVSAAVLLAAVAFGLSQGLQSGGLRLVLALAGGVVGFLLGNAFYFLVVFLYGAVAGLVLTVLGAGAAGAQAVPSLLMIGGAAGGGALALLFERPAGIFCTAAIGAFALASLVQMAVGGGPPRVGSAGTLGFTALLSWAVLTVLGCVAQAKTTRQMPPPAGKGAGPKKP